MSACAQGNRRGLGRALGGEHRARRGLVVLGLVQYFRYRTTECHTVDRCAGFKRRTCTMTFKEADVEATFLAFHAGSESDVATQGDRERTDQGVPDCITDAPSHPC